MTVSHEWEIEIRFHKLKEQPFPVNWKMKVFIK